MRTTWTCKSSSSAATPAAHDVLQISADVYGLPGNKETSPGLMGDVAELRRSRKLMLWRCEGPGCC